MYRNMAAAIFTHGRIITTPAKAKEARPFVEKLITLAKKGAGDLAARRRAIRLLHDPALVRSLFEDLGVRYTERQGGYTRILHLSKTRVGDGARQVLFELVEGGAPAGKAKSSKPRRAAVVAEGGKAEAAAAAATAAATAEAEKTGDDAVEKAEGEEKSE
jgi:large subunit ribosomal protein L17